MNEKQIFDAVTNVSDELIEEAKPNKLKRRPYGRLKFAAIAAAAALILVFGLIFSGARNGNLFGSPETGAILDVIYPKAYAFDDHNAWIEVRMQNPVDDSFIQAINEFSYKTGAFMLSGGSKNINYSPLSLYFALSLAASGAEGGTEAELLALLGVSDTQVLSEQCANLYRTLYRDNEIGKLKIANSIWMDNEFNGEPVMFKDDFVKHAAENFYASSHSVDFALKETGKAMADWISVNTNGTLSPTIETDSEQLLSILNAVYFYDEWIDRFDKGKTAEDVFHLSDGGDVKADFMNQTFASAGYAKGKGFTRAGLGLKNAGEMVFILPDEGVSPYELLSTPEQMQETFEGGENLYSKVVWKIPKFSFGSKLAMTDALKSLGISSAFTTDADFSRITDHMAYITNVQQETHIAIDENGVEASAFTRIDYAGSALPQGQVDMILDRPFIYGITSRDGILLFVGVCENPAQ